MAWSYGLRNISIQCMISRYLVDIFRTVLLPGNEICTTAFPIRVPSNDSPLLTHCDNVASSAWHNLLAVAKFSNDNVILIFAGGIYWWFYLERWQDPTCPVDCNSKSFYKPQQLSFPTVSRFCFTEGRPKLEIFSSVAQKQKKKKDSNKNGKSAMCTW